MEGLPLFRIEKFANKLSNSTIFEKINFALIIKLLYLSPPMSCQKMIYGSSGIAYE